MKLKEIRVEKKLSQYELADRSGISQNYISELENGRHEATEEVIIKLCIALEVDPNTLLGWEKLKKERDESIGPKEDLGSVKFLWHIYRRGFKASGKR